MMLKGADRQHIHRAVKTVGGWVMIRRILAAVSAAVMIFTAVPVSAYSEQAGDSYAFTSITSNDLAMYDLQQGTPVENSESEIFGQDFMSGQQTFAASGTITSTFLKTTSAYVSDEAFNNFRNPDSARAFFSTMLSWAEGFYMGTLNGTVKTFNYSNGTSSTAFVAKFNFSDLDITLNEAEAVYAMLRNACPLTYYFTRNVTYSYVGGVPAVLYPHLDEAYETASARAEVRTMVDEYIASYSGAASEKSLYHKAKFIHDKEVNEMSYAFKADGYTAEDEEWAHNIIGPMTRKKGVCEAYSRTYEMLVNYYGGEAMYVSGQAGGWNPKLGQTSWGPHAWNVIKLDDGKYYLTDTTFDDPVITYSNGTTGEALRYDYFAKGTDALANTHIVTQPVDLSASNINPLNYQFALPDIPAGDFSLEWLENYLNHEHRYVSSVTKNPSCTEEGVMTYVCRICGDSYNEAISMTDHEYQTIKTVSSTCTANGYTLCRCKNCGKEINTDIQPLIAHSYVSEVRVQPTCTEDGERIHTCTVCQNRRTEVITALGHDMKKYRTEPSTCVTHGYTVYRCSRCDHEEIRDEKPLASHSYTVEITKQATCKDTGIMTFTCSVCNDTFTETIPLGAHSYELSEIILPTCTEDGCSVYLCSVCGDREERDVTPAKGHTIIHVAEQPASCENDGKASCWKCSDCDALFADRDGTETIDEPEVIPALGHRYEFVTRVEPTYDQDGYELWVCSRDPDHVRRDVITKKERSINDAQIILAHDVYEYTGWAVTPRVKVYFEGELLAENVDYELGFNNNTAIGAKTAKAVVTGIGRFVGETEISFSIVPEINSFDAVSVQGDGLYLRWDADVTADGYEIQYSRDPSFPEGKTFTKLIIGKNTTATGSMPEAGALWYVRVRSYVEDGQERFGIWSGASTVRVSGSLDEIKLARTSYTYTGKAIDPAVTVKDKAGRVLVKGTDYRLYYTNNVKIGTATVKAVGIGRYSGSVSAHFAVIPGKINNVIPISVGKGALSVTVTDADSGSRGVQFEISDDPYFREGVRTVTLSGSGNKSAYVTGLESGRTYYVRAKAFTEMLGTAGKLGTWSNVRTVTVR